MIKDNAVQTLVEQISKTEKEKSKTYSAVVSHVDNEGVVWVRLAGAEKETPTASTSVEAKSGDIVNVEWRNNKLYIAGNYSRPSASVQRVFIVERQAQDAQDTAYNAQGVAVEANEKAESALSQAEETSSYFWYNNGSGTEAGAHITETDRETFETTPSGGNVLITSLGLIIRKGLQTFAQFIADGLHIQTYDSNNNAVEIAHLGYGQGNAESGTAEKPYYTIGQRLSGSSIGNWSVAEGFENIASGYCSHVEGRGCVAIGNSSHAQNYSTVAESRFQTALGKWNVADSNNIYAVIIGNGDNNSARSNALEVAWNGNVNSHGNVSADGLLKGRLDKLYTIIDVDITLAAINAHSNIAAQNYNITNIPTGYRAVGVVGYVSDNYRIRPTTNYITSAAAPTGTVYAGFSNASASNVSAGTNVTFKILCLHTNAYS